MTYYLDHCGTTPLDGDVKLAMIHFINSNNFGNPTANHHFAGRRAYEALETARETVAQELQAKPNQIIFTSGASEANNLVLWGFALRYREQGCRILYGATEHKSVFETAQNLANLPGVSADEIKVLPDGSLDLEHLKTELQKSKGQPTLLAAMHINNEVPARHPVEQISEICATNGAFFHSDGVQGFVRETLNFNHGVFGSYVISAHKIYGPKGLGVLVLGDGPLSCRINPPFHGGSHERGLRPGTHNTLAIIGGTEAIKSHNNKRHERLHHMKICAETFFATLKNKLPEATLTIPLSDKASGLVNFYIPGLDAPTILAQNSDICINRGASCLGAGGESFSHVPKALGLPVEVQANVLRASFGAAISIQQSKEAAEIFAERVKVLIA